MTLIHKYMKKDILDKYGKLVIETVYDDVISYFNQLLSGTTKWGTGKEYTEVFHKLSESDQAKLLECYKHMIRTTIFGMLAIFEENPEFKIIYEKDGVRIDLVETSEMLKAEPIIKGGWIERFSQYSRKKDESA